MNKFVFHSIYKEHRVILEPKMTKTENGFPTRTPGVTVEFNNFIYDTTNADVAQALRNYIKKSKTVDIKEITQVVNKPVDVLKKLKGQ